MLFGVDNRKCSSLVQQSLFAWIDKYCFDLIFFAAFASNLSKQIYHFGCVLLNMSESTAMVDTGKIAGD